MEESAAPNACNSSRAVLERRARPQEQLNCPRCNSSNTKFCYYNNYSLTQPRYFCKTCRRYWTEGGSLRNVPVGGGSRKNKKIMSSSSANKLPDLNPSSTLNISHHHFSSHQNPNKTAGMPQGQDLNLGFPPCSVQEYYHAISQYVQVPKVDQDQTTGTSSSSSLPLQLRDGTSCPRGSLASFLSGAASAFYPPQPPPGGGFSSHLQELKPSLCFSDQDISNGGKLLFPMGGMNMKQVSNTSDHHHQVQLADGHHHHHGKEQSSSSSGYWSNGMLGGGGSW